jgi:mycoredoxin
VTENIVMYGADWCGDCRRSKAFLERRGVPFTYVDLEERPDQMDEVIRRNEGMRSIPVIVFDDGSHLTEPSNADLAAKLGL